LRQCGTAQPRLAALGSSRSRDSGSDPSASYPRKTAAGPSRARPSTRQTAGAGVDSACSHPQLSRRDRFQEPLGRQLAAQPERAGALHYRGAHGSELDARAGVVVVQSDLLGAGAALDVARDQLLDLVDVIPGDDAALGSVPDVRRLVLLCDV